MRRPVLSLQETEADQAQPLWPTLRMKARKERWGDKRRDGELEGREEEWG